MLLCFIITLNDGITHRMEYWTWLKKSINGKLALGIYRDGLAYEFNQWEES